MSILAKMKSDTAKRIFGAASEIVPDANSGGDERRGMYEKIEAALEAEGLLIAKRREYALEIANVVMSAVRSRREEVEDGISGAVPNGWFQTVTKFQQRVVAERRLPGFDPARLVLWTLILLRNLEEYEA